MRTVLIVLVIANLIVFAAQFAVVRRAVLGDDSASRPVQLNAERLRIIRDTSVRPVAPPAPAT